MAQAATNSSYRILPQIARRPALGEQGTLEETCKRFELNYQSAANAKSVCVAFEFSRRREKLTFSHYQEVQGRDDAEELLDWCEEKIADKVQS